MLASGVCHSDLHVRDGEWDRPGPIVMGHEGAGIIEALGPGVDGAVGPRGRAARRAGVDDTVRPMPVVPGRPNLGVPGLSVVHAPDAGRARRGCHGPRTARSVLSYCAIGTMAEAQVVPVAAAIPMPDGTTPDVAALIGCCVATGVGAVTKTVAGGTRGRASRSSGSVASGCRPSWARRWPARAQIVAVDRVAAKLDLARELGCDRHGPRRRRRRGDCRGDPRRDRRRAGRLRRGDRAAVDDRDRDRLPAERRHGLARRDDALRGPGLVRGLPVRRRRPADRRLELRLGGAVGRLSRGTPSSTSTAACRSIGSSPERIALDGLEAAFDRMRRGEGVRSVIEF